MNVLEQEKVQSSEARKAQYPVVMELLQHLRTNKALQDKVLHPMLDKAWSEAKYYGDEAKIMLRRVLLHIGDVSRQHNMLKELGITSPTGGAGERANFRSVMRWWEQKHPKHFYKNLRLFGEFTVLENLLYDQIRTNRMKGTILSTERMEFDVDKIVSYFANMIRKSKNPLIARHLPKYNSAKFRYTDGKKRAKQSETLAKQKRARIFINKLCTELGWSLKDYREYRKKQNTPEQLFSSQEIKKLSEDLLFKLFDRMTASQRFRVSHMICEKDALGHMKPKEKWETIGLAYIKWEQNQTKVAEKIRNTTDEVDRAKVAKDFKVKATGLQTIDILGQLLQGSHTAEQVNNTYQALLEKMDLIGNVYPVLDGSASMNRSISNTWGGPDEPYDSKYGDISMFHLACAMGIAFATRNPNPEYKNSLGWFSNNFIIIGESKYKNTAPNPFVTGQQFIKTDDGTPVISEKYPFTKNLMRLSQANPGRVASTNIGAAVEYFVNLHKKTGMRVEDLPIALLFITDNEGNNGMSPKEFMKHANSIGWYPLVIFWGLKTNRMTQYKDVPNCLFVGGFNESVLGQILRGIKSGTVMPEAELWSINDDKRYSVMK